MMTICGKEIKIDGTGVRIAHVAEGFDSADHFEEIVSALKKSGQRIDLFTFIQRLSETTPLHNYPMEWDNFAVLPVTTYDHWFTKQIKTHTRNKIRKAEKAGLAVREVPFDDVLIRGISVINNESPVRQGRPFWHYKDDLETVRRKNGTFLSQSVFLGVFHEGVMIGYAKLVSDPTQQQAGLMQILTMLQHRDKATSNLLISEAVRSCANRSIPNLWYANFSYGKKGKDGLSDFKEQNGFRRVDIPRFYIPITLLGRIALRLSLHRGLKEHVPWSLQERMRKFRNRWYDRKLQDVKTAS
jgi:hypothetical protein